MLDKRYNPKEVEQGKYQFWKKEGYFTAGDNSKPAFSMVIPPPNVTGKLHLGHAWDTTTQDITARYKVTAELSDKINDDSFFRVKLQKRYFFPNMLEYYMNIVSIVDQCNEPNCKCQSHKN